MRRSMRRGILIAIVGLALTGLVWRLGSGALEVDTVRAVVAPLRETIDEEGETRVRDRYVVAAPVTGRLSRVALRAGDPVARGALIGWLEPAPLDLRTRRQAEAGAEAAEDAWRASQAGVAAARLARDQAMRERTRAESLAARGHLAAAALEETVVTATTREREYEAARSRAETAAHDLERARAALVQADGPPGARGSRTPIRAPVAGRILRIWEESERVVPAGSAVVEIGDPRRLEVVADLLTADAARVRPGDTVLVEGWGGDSILRARLRRVEPSGFTRVSALGVEEQRVHVLADLTEPPEALGDRYRVEVRIVLWGSAGVLQVPASALVRDGARWTVFVIERGRVRLRTVTPGHRGAWAVEIQGGLHPGEEILAYPGTLVREGDRVRARPLREPS